MKRTIFAGIAILTFGVFSLNANASSADRTFDEYSISEVEVQNLESHAEKAWVLSYSSNESPIIITLQESKHRKTYLVRADHFEVAYVTGKDGFGARNVRVSESTLPYEFTSNVINDSELAKQRILSPDKVDDNKALGLIAAYLPDLVNPSYQHLLN